MSYNRRPGQSVGGVDARLTAASGGRDVLDGLQKDSISTLDKPTDKPGGDDIALKNLEYIGSYNWVEATKPTVIVPGSPPEWTDRPLPIQVPLDSNKANFIDQNGYRMKDLSLLPLVQVVEAVNIEEDKPDFDWPSVDFVTDRNGLRKLLRWVNATADKPPRDFRIDTQLAGEKTILLKRWEKVDREGPGSENQPRSYGFNFERASTKPVAGCTQSTGYHRVITYDFDGLKMVVRFEVDACLPSTPKQIKSTKPTPKSSSPSPAASNNDEEELANMLSNLTVGSSTAPSRRAHPELDIIWAGAQVPQSSIIEMTTRSELSVQNFDWADVYPQLYFSQTPLLYLAVHKRGRFLSVTKRQLGQGDLVKIDREAQPGFRKMRQVLEVIQHLVKKHGLEGKISLVCTAGVLKVYKRSVDVSYLPDKLLALFDRKN